jgi:hypothetical protein
MFGKIAFDAFGQGLGIDFFDQELIECSGQFACQPNGFTSVDWLTQSVASSLNNRRKTHGPFKRCDCRRDVRARTHGIQRAAQCLYDLRIADRNQPRQEQSSFCAAHKCVLDRPCCPIGWYEDDPARKPERIFPVQA